MLEVELHTKDAGYRSRQTYLRCGTVWQLVRHLLGTYGVTLPHKSGQRPLYLLFKSDEC